MKTMAVIVTYQELFGFTFFDYEKDTLLIQLQGPHPISELTKFMNDPCLSFEKNQPNLPLKCSNIYVMQRRHVC